MQVRQGGPQPRASISVHPVSPLGDLVTVAPSGQSGTAGPVAQQACSLCRHRAAVMVVWCSCICSQRTFGGVWGPMQHSHASCRRGWPGSPSLCASALTKRRHRSPSSVSSQLVCESEGSAGSRTCPHNSKVRDQGLWVMCKLQYRQPQLASLLAVQQW